MPKVEMYTKDFCPYCVRAKNLLISKGVKLTEHYYNGTNDELLDEMIERSEGMRSFPQIFIDDFHVGGCDDLYALDAQKKLDSLLGK